ncbi:electron transfer flavoprotein subunit alpha [Actinomycetota bacterium]|nr:electron transfer flavoprotein subunit alpha [Actinomycetota bacterium]
MTTLPTPAAGPVLVLLDHDVHPDGTVALRPAVLELLTLARPLAGVAGVQGVWVGDAPTDAVLPVLAAHGLAALHTVDVGAADPRLTPVLAEALGALVGELVGADGVGLVLAVSTFENKEAVARLGVARHDAGVVTDATTVTHDGTRYVATKTVFAGTWDTRCAVTTALAVVTVKAGSVPAEPAAAPTDPQVVAHTAEISARAQAVTVVERTDVPGGDRPDLASAQIVVVGGRGTEGNFAPLEELADVLGGAVGATRVATDEGWIGHDAQIGQTGVTVSPRVYIGAGVSGAVHHRGGMQASGTIIAVNSDPEAPIFEIADLGIIGDLFTVLPQATQALREQRG